MKMLFHPNKKGIYFTVDAMFAALIIIGALAFILAQPPSDQDTRLLETTAQDAVSLLSILKLNEINDPVLLAAVLNTNKTNENESVLRAIGVLWATDDALAPNLTRAALEMFNTTVNYGVYIEGQPLYINSTIPSSSASRLQTARQQISGIAQGKPIEGSTAAAFLQKLQNKTTSSLTYFGGFVGQGNITVLLTLPPDVDATRVSSLTLELDTPQDFFVRVNGDGCGSYSPTSPSMQADIWNLAGCINQLVSGDNQVQLVFNDLAQAYVAGGYIKASYRTDTFTAASDLNKTLYRFPEIDGVVNLYDSFYVPQTLRNMSIYLHYTANDPTAVSYLSIGEKTVYSSNQTGTVSVTLTDYNLTFAGLDYALLSNTTVPIRFSAFNSTVTILSGGNADVILVTDYSGSMKKSIADWGQGTAGNIADCPSIFANPDIRRTHLARCLDKEVIEIVLNASFFGNRLWPVHYVNDVVYWYNNPQDNAALTGFYNSYTGTFPQQGTDKTCIACALSRAYEVFETYSNPLVVENRSRYVILMSDGLPTHCTDAGCNARSVNYGAQMCEGLCDVNGQNCNAFGNMCTDSSCQGPIDNAIVVSQQLKDDFNATIFTVGFGPVGTCTNATQLLQRIADITNGTYQHSDNPEELRDIYINISTEILESLTLTSQKVTVPGAAIPSKLHGDSYLLAVHDKSADVFPNQIEITRQTPQFGICNPVVNFPTEVTVLSAQLVSYSAEHWTDYVSVNDQEAFNLSNYFVDYSRLGDPFLVHIPRANITDSNQFYFRTGDAPDNYTGCSPDNSLVYTLLVPSATPRTTVYANATGCVWNIENDDGSFQVVAIPRSYAAGNTCSYTNASISYKDDDAYDVAAYSLLQTLDYDKDGRIFLSLADEDIEIIVNTVSGVPYLWGPSTVEVRVWQ